MKTFFVAKCAGAVKNANCFNIFSQNFRKYARKFKWLTSLKLVKQTFY